MNTDRLRLYPDPTAAPLVNALADFYHVNPDQVFVGVGSDDVLSMCFLTFFNSEKPIFFPAVSYTHLSPLMRVVVRIALLPVIAGISYEVLKLAGNSENALVNLLSKPGMAIQMMPTSEPDDDMIEVAIQAVEAVFDWRAYERENFHTS